MFRKTKTAIPPFYERHPVRSLQWRTTEEGKVVILHPKMGTHRLGVWLSNRMARPYCKIKLDEYGSGVWKACDGESSVHQLVDAFSETPGPEWQERLARFLHHLRNMGMIHWKEEKALEEPATPAHAG